MKMKNKGITLVALVVTIIVLLILAAITMTFVLGDNGIITKANQAKKETKQAQEDESINLDNLEKEIGKYDIVTNTNDKNPGVLSGTGTTEDPYLIESIEDLVILSKETESGANTYAGKTVKLGLSIDFNDTKSYVDPRSTSLGDINGDGNTDEIMTELTTSKGWMPIGSFEKPFAGNFDGNNKQILNFYMNRNSDERVYYGATGYGLFGNINGNISNLLVSGNLKIDIKVYAANAKFYIGGIAGKIAGKIEKVTNNINLEIIQSDNNTKISNVFAGGVSGYSKSLIECINNGNIKIQANDNKLVYCVVGGLEGNAMQSVGDKLINNGQIEVYNMDAGNIAGIVGTLFGGEIKNSENNGKIIIKSYMSGTIKYARAGGIVGESNAAKVSNSINKGEIQVDRKAETSDFECSIGGIVGKDILSSSILNVINEGNINYSSESKYSSQVGGIIGCNTLGNIRYSWNIENVINLGGININDLNIEENDEHHIDVAGILGKSEYTATPGFDCKVVNIYNQGKIKFDGGVNNKVNIAGIFGQDTQNNSAKIKANNLMNKGEIQINDEKINKIGFISSSDYNFDTQSNMFINNNLIYSGTKRATNTAESSISVIDMNTDNVINQMNSSLAANYCRWKNDNGKVSLEF